MGMSKSKAERRLSRALRRMLRIRAVNAKGGEVRPWDPADSVRGVLSPGYHEPTPDELEKLGALELNDHWLSLVSPRRPLATTPDDRQHRTMRANGVQADVDFDGQHVTFHAGKIAAKIQHTDTIRVPVYDIAAVRVTTGNVFVRGGFKLTLKDPSPDRLLAYGADQPNTVNTQSFTVAFAPKKADEWASLATAIEAGLTED